VHCVHKKKLQLSLKPIVFGSDDGFHKEQNGADYIM